MIYHLKIVYFFFCISKVYFLPKISIVIIGLLIINNNLLISYYNNIKEKNEIFLYKFKRLK